MNLGQRNQVQAGGNMSSMTDLVFLLLIFFVILSTLVSNGGTRGALAASAWVSSSCFEPKW